jgi:hypothetical protein
MAELLLDFAERDPLPDLVDGRTMPKVPTPATTPVASS